MRRHKLEDRKTVVTIALQLSTLASLDELATKRNVSRSELIEQATRMLLREAADEIECAS